MTRRHRHEQPRRRKTGTDRHLYYIASSWYEICGKLSEEHLQGGPHVKEIRNWRSATRYVEKYVAKPEAFPRGDRDGQDLGDVEWGDAHRPAGDGESERQRGLLDQEDLQKIGRDEG